MNKQQREEIARILDERKGDDLYRAKLVFKGTNLDEQWGLSGKTKRQIMAEYEAHDAHIEELKKALYA